MPGPPCVRADLALFVVSGVDGVEVQTELMWKVAEDEGIPRAIMITKLDRERSSFSRVLAQLKEVFGKRIAPIQVPIGSEGDLRGVVRVVSGRAFTYGPDDKVGHRERHDAAGGGRTGGLHP